MTSLGRSPVGIRLRAPREDGGKLIIPPWNEAASLLRDNKSLLDGSHYNLQGRTLGDLRKAARAELIAAAREYTSRYRTPTACTSASTVILAGHQPQMFHPGVWFKNFALGGLAKQHRAVGINLVIDDDTLKQPSIRVPGGSPEEPTFQDVFFDRVGVVSPFEERAIADPEMFASFGSRVEEQLRGLIAEPLIRSYWPLVLERARSGDRLGSCLAIARHTFEERFGNQTLELPQSRLCELEACRWFIVHLLADLPRFAEVHNQALEAYRRANHIRSSHHPVPALATDGPWQEAPFWVWQEGEALRRRLFVRRAGNQLELGDRAGWTRSIPLSAAADGRAAVEALADLARKGTRLRTRALTTTMFARLVAGDLFLHGIGGGKYDELTDEIVSRYFGFTPPAFMVISGTLLLPVRHQRVTQEEIQQATRTLREMSYHPERFLDPHELQQTTADKDPDGNNKVALLEAKQRWIATEKTPDNAHERHQAITRANAILSPILASQRQALAARRDELARLWRGETILSWREFAFCLYPEKTLRNFLLEIPSPTP